MNHQEPKEILGDNILNILNVNNSKDIIIMSPWIQGGAETYITDFLLLQNNEYRHYIAKACIKFFPIETMDEWIDRRVQLNNNGLLSPEILARDGATIIEEFIPYTFVEAFNIANDKKKIKLKNHFIDAYNKIFYAGFSPNCLHDSRSHGDDIIVIDFGEDLGGKTSVNAGSINIAINAEKSFRTLVYS